MFLPAFPSKKLAECKRAFIIFPLPELKNFVKRLFLKKIYSWLSFCFYKNPSEDFIMVGPVLGASPLAFLMESLVISGIREILALGWAGSTISKQFLPQIFLPEKALCFEGTSKFVSFQNTFMPDKEMLNKLKELLNLKKVSYEEGVILSTDFPQFFENLALRGFLRIEYPEVKAMDMETSALFSLATHFGIKVCAIHFLVDRVGETSFSLPQNKLEALRDSVFSTIKEFLMS